MPVGLAVVGTGGDPGHAPARRVYEKVGFVGLPLVRYYARLDPDAGTSRLSAKEPVGRLRSPVRDGDLGCRRRRPPQSQLVGHDLDSGLGAAVLGGPAPPLEPAL